MTLQHDLTETIDTARLEQMAAYASSFKQERVFRTRPAFFMRPKVLGGLSLLAAASVAGLLFLHPHNVPHKKTNIYEIAADAVMWEALEDQAI